MLNKLDITCGTQHNKHKTLVLVRQTCDKNNISTNKHNTRRVVTRLTNKNSGLVLVIVDNLTKIAIIGRF